MMFDKIVVSLAFVFALLRPAESLNCFQQSYTPGIISGNNPLMSSNQQQQQQYAGSNYAQLALPSITCSPNANSCFKFVCWGATPYTVKGCLDYTQPQVSCQTLDAQCLGGQGNCYVCSGNNCNGALSMHGNPARLIVLSAVISIGAYFLKNSV